MDKLLIIDDEKIILENLKFLLELHNYEVLTASSSKEGIELFDKNFQNIKAVITDMKMPGLSGMDILKYIKNICKEMSVIILTGHGDIENAILAMKQGAFEYLKKPVNIEELLITINNAINNKNQLEEINKMQNEILEHKNYLENLYEASQKILLNMLPKELPNLNGYNFFVKYKSSDLVGGDMYNVCDIGDYVFLYVFDVSSHGILASIIATIVKSFLENVQYNYKQGINKRRFPEIVYDLNNYLYSLTEQNVFATLFLAFIDKKDNFLYCVSAGHIPQILLKKDEIIEIPSTGALLGAFENTTYTCNVLKILKGEKIILFTDGIVEADKDEEIFGMDRIKAHLAKNNEMELEVIINSLFTSVLNFSKNNITDDMTILGAKIL